MKPLRLAAVLAVATLAITPASMLAQDKGKTEAAKLTKASQAALKKLTAGVPLARELEKTAEAILVFRKSRRPASGSAVSTEKARC